MPVRIYGHTYRLGHEWRVSQAVNSGRQELWHLLSSPEVRTPVLSTAIGHFLGNRLQEKPHGGAWIFRSMFVSPEMLSAYPAACLFPSHYQLA